MFPIAASARESACPALIKPQTPVTLPASNPVTGHLNAVNGEGNDVDEASLAMDFGPDRARDVRTQTYRLSPGLDPTSVRVYTVNDIVDHNDPLPIGHQQLTYRAGTTPAGDLVNVRVCYDPGGYREPTAGRYVGALLVTAPGAKSVPLAVEFTFRDNNLIAIVAALLIGIVAGVVLQAFAIRQQAPKETRPTTVRSYLLNFRILFAVGGGVVGALTAYSKLVADNPTWDGSVSSLLSLVTAAFGATVVTKAAFDLKSPTETEKDAGLAAKPAAVPG